jgi:mannose-1-phosphate guanylyltransferase
MRRLMLFLSHHDASSGPAVAVAAGIAARRAPDTIVVAPAADHVVRDRVGLFDIVKRREKLQPKAISSP